MSTGQIKYGCVDGTHVFEFIGEVRAVSCVCLSDMVDAFAYIANTTDNNLPPANMPQCLQGVSSEHIKCLLVDLNQSEFLDSTALGMIARLGAVFSQQFGRQCILLCTNPATMELVKSMALHKLFVVLNSPSDSMPTAQLADDACNSAAELHQTVLEAHKVLVTISQHNKHAFASLVCQLEGVKPNV